MPETAPPKQEVHHPATVGSTFMRQYYHFLAKEPASLHRFYKDESTWCHGHGSHMQEAISGQTAINDAILRRGYAGARVDLDIGSIDCQASLHGGVFVLVTGVMTLVGSPAPQPFVQTFFLAVQPKGYFVLNDCLRFLELPGASASAAPTDGKQPQPQQPPAQAAIGTPVAAAAASPVTAKSKPVTPIAASKKDKVPASPVAKPAETPMSPLKVKSPAKVASPEAAAAPAPAPVSPVKKAAAPPTEAKTTPKPSETKPATPASPAAAPTKPVAAAPADVKPAPAKPAAPPAPKTWAALFSGGAPAAPKAAPAPKHVVPASPAKEAEANPTKAADATAAGTAAAPQDKAQDKEPKERKRYSSLFIRDIPAQTKEADLRELFKPYGSIAAVTVPSGRGFAFVDFYEEESMRAALADDKEFKLFDKTIHVDERSDRKDANRSGFRTDSRGGRGGRGAPKSGRSGDRKDREDGKERRPGDREAAGANGKAPSSTNGPRAANNGDRREKGGRRSGKEDGGRGSN